MLPERVGTKTKYNKNARIIQRHNNGTKFTDTVLFIFLPNVADFFFVNVGLMSTALSLREFYDADFCECRQQVGYVFGNYSAIINYLRFILRKAISHQYLARSKSDTYILNIIQKEHF